MTNTLSYWYTLNRMHKKSPGLAGCLFLQNLFSLNENFSFLFAGMFFSFPFRRRRLRRMGV